MILNNTRHVVLDCGASGFGTISYHWEKKPIDGGSWISIKNNSGIYMIVDLQESSIFRCTASNGAGKNETIFTVISNQN